MAIPMDNIEPLVRAICDRGLRRVGWSEVEVQRSVERHRHCVAAEFGGFD